MDLEANNDVMLKIAKNHLITKGIIKFLNFTELKIFRLVCTRWWNDSMEKWNETAWAYVTPDSSAFKNLANWNRKSINKKPAYKKVCLLGWDFKENKEEYRKVLNAIKKSVEQLRFVDCDIRSPSFETAKVLLPIYQNISSLQMIRTRYYGLTSKIPEHINLSRLEIHSPKDLAFDPFCKSPNLKEIKVTNEKYCGRSGLLFDILANIRLSLEPQSRILALTHVDVMESVQNLSALKHITLPLKYLTLCVTPHYSVYTLTEQQLELEQILEHYNMQLETLKLFRLPTSDNPPFPTFPFQVFLTSLVELELWGRMTDNLNFLKFTPLLKKLKMDHFCFEKRHLLPNENLCNCPDDIVEKSELLQTTDNFQVCSLQQFIFDRKLKIASWKILKTWMPNLEVLEAPLDNDTFDVVCSQWKNLHRLKLAFGSSVDDDGITGPLPWMEQPAGIVQLINLKEFELWMECGAAGEITDKAAEQGFLKLNFLRRLKIFGAQMSPSVMELLKMSINELAIFPKCSNDLLDEAPCCQWVKHQNSFI